MKNSKETLRTEQIQPDIPPIKPRRKKKKGWIIFIILAILAIVAFLFRAPILNGLRNIPFVGQFIPSESEEASVTKEELVVQAKEQANKIANLEKQIDQLEEINNDLKAKNETLKVYETQYANFLAQKEDWDKEVAKTNTDLFIKQFESIYPETAADIYEKFKGEEIISKEQKALSKAVGEMDEDQAAKALEVLLSTDPELVKMIVGGMKDDQKALVLSSMSSSGAAQVIKLLSPNVGITP